VEVAAGGTTCISHITNELASFYFLAGPNDRSTQMSVQSGVSVAVIDDDVVSVAPGFGFYQRYGSVGCRVNFGAYGGGEVHSGVERWGVIEGVSAIAKSASELT